MNISNNVSLMGRMVRDMEIKYTPSGKQYGKFTVACNRDYANSEGEREADFIECIAWGKKAEFIQKNFSKGRGICVNGSLRNNNYTDKDGIKRYGYCVNVTDVNFPVSWKAKNEASNQNEYYSLPDDYPIPDDVEITPEYEMDGVTF